jgi:hypothetical protein
MPAAQRDRLVHYHMELPILLCFVDTTQVKEAMRTKTNNMGRDAYSAVDIEYTMTVIYSHCFLAHEPRSKAADPYIDKQEVPGNK